MTALLNIWSLWSRVQPVCPPMPPNAISPALRIMLGKAGVLAAWESLYEKAMATGMEIGTAKGATEASFFWVMVLVVVLAIVIRRK